MTYLGYADEITPELIGSHKAQGHLTVILHDATEEDYDRLKLAFDNRELRVFKSILGYNPDIRRTTPTKVQNVKRRRATFTNPTHIV